MFTKVFNQILSYCLVFLLFLFAVGTLQQSCTIKPNSDYSTDGDLVKLYKVTSAQACCDACKGILIL